MDASGGTQAEYLTAMAWCLLVPVAVVIYGYLHEALARRPGSTSHYRRFALLFVAALPVAALLASVTPRQEPVWQAVVTGVFAALLAFVPARAFGSRAALLAVLVVTILVYSLAFVAVRSFLVSPEIEAMLAVEFLLALGLFMSLREHDIVFPSFTVVGAGFAFALFLGVSRFGGSVTGSALCAAGTLVMYFFLREEPFTPRNVTWAAGAVLAVVVAVVVVDLAFYRTSRSASFVQESRISDLVDVAGERLREIGDLLFSPWGLLLLADLIVYATLFRLRRFLGRALNDDLPVQASLGAASAVGLLAFFVSAGGLLVLTAVLGAVLLVFYYLSAELADSTFTPSSRARIQAASRRR